MADYFTVGDIAKLYAVEPWRVRRVVDGMQAEIARFGRYRLIPRELLGEVAAELRDRGWLNMACQTGGRADG